MKNSPETLVEIFSWQNMNLWKLHFKGAYIVTRYILSYIHTHTMVYVWALECFIMSLPVVQNAFLETFIDLKKENIISRENRNSKLVKTVSSSFSPKISVLRYLQAVANVQHTSAFEVLGQLLEKFFFRY